MFSGRCHDSKSCLNRYTLYTGVHRTIPHGTSGTTSARNERLSAPDRGGLQTGGRLQTGVSTHLEVVWRVSPYNACVVPILYRAYACAVRLALCVCSQTYASHVMPLGEGKPRLMLGWSRDRPRAYGTSHPWHCCILRASLKGLLQRRLENRCKRTTMTAGSHATMPLINRLSRFISD